MCEEISNLKLFCKCLLKTYLGSKTRLKSYSSIVLTSSVFDYSITIVAAKNEAFTFFIKKILGNILSYKENNGFLELDQYEAYKKLFRNFKQFEEVINPEFIIVDISSDIHYYVYNEKPLQKYSLSRITLETIDLDHIKIILSNISNIHANTYICREKVNKELTKRINVSYGTRKNIYTFEDNYLGKHQSHIEDIVGNALNKITQSKNSVLSLKNFSLSDVIFTYTNNKPVNCKFINSDHYRHSPLELDILQIIFSVTSQHLRQHYYEEIINIYYQHIKEKTSTTQIINRDNFEINIHQYLPFVKLNTVYNILESENWTIASDYNRVAISELTEVFKSPNQISTEDCYKIIKKQIGTSNYDLLDYKLLPFDGRSGFLGSYGKLNISINNLEKNRQDFVYFVKFLPLTQESLDIVVQGGAFEKEIFFYTTLVQDLKEVGLDIIETCIPQCFLSRSNNVIIFQDLSALKYDVEDPKKPYTTEALKIVLKCLAVFHGCMFMYEEIVSTKLDIKYKEFVNESLITREHSTIKSYFETGIRCACETLIDQFSDICKKLSVEEFKSRMQIAFDKSFGKVLKSNKLRNLINHGDLWATNILFRKEGQDFVDCKFIDLQLIRYCPPAHDILMVLYMTTSREYRLQNLQSLLDFYYSELTLILSKYGYSVEKIFPYEEYKESLDYMKSQIVCQMAVYYPLIMVESSVHEKLLNDADKMNRIFLRDRNDYVKENIKTSETYRKKMIEVVEEMYDMCLENNFDTLK